MLDTMIKFTFSDDLADAKERLKTYVKDLNAATDKPGIDVRLTYVNELIDSYVEATGTRPDPYQLYGLGSYLLDDYLIDQYKHLRKDDHPFQTDARVRKNHARNRTVFLGDRTDV